MIYIYTLHSFNPQKITIFQPTKIHLYTLHSKPKKWKVHANAKYVKSGVGQCRRFFSFFF
ncbi:hypothetical protein HanRHA438_Chr05g0246831 [Helianthus annuus]|nr:hypothetical protein HanIR_Chr05g0255421 [Helianthus annuus]KAJ0920946.1 hypothetical protein HanRHA438_Chr05g0246831 [Helianthus annuus]